MTSAHHIRHRILLGVVAATLVLGAIVLASGCGGSSGPPPASGGARLVPADALVYVHISTDRSRKAVTRALSLLGGFPSFPRVRDSLLARFAGGAGQLDFKRDVGPWIGKEAALALLNSSGATAGSLLIASVRDRARARTFLGNLPGRTGSASYRGIPITTYGSTATAFVGGYLVIAPLDAIHAAADALAGRAPSLARNPVYVRAVSDLAKDRSADVYASRDGVRRLLAPQAGVLGALGVLLDQPALAGTALSISAQGDGADFHVHTALDPRQAKGRKPSPAFAPELLSGIPDTAMAYLGVTHLDRYAGLLLRAGAQGAVAGRRLLTLLRAARGDLQRKTGVDVDRDVLPLFRGEVALWLKPAVPAPTLTLIARTANERATREAFAKLQAPLAKLFVPKASGPGQAPTFEEHDVDGTQAFSLRLGPGVELDYAVFDGKLVVSTSLDGITAIKQSKSALQDTGAFKTTLGGRPSKVSSLLFLDFSQLLRLGEQTGLTTSQSYLAVRQDLAKVRALGASATAGSTDSTADLFLEIK